jgi:hypothetical protein
LNGINHRLACGADYISCPRTDCFAACGANGKSRERPGRRASRNRKRGRTAGYGCFVNWSLRYEGFSPCNQLEYQPQCMAWRETAFVNLVLRANPGLRILEDYGHIAKRLECENGRGKYGARCAILVKLARMGIGPHQRRGDSYHREQGTGPAGGSEGRPSPEAGADPYQRQETATAGSRGQAPPEVDLPHSNSISKLTA